MNIDHIIFDIDNAPVHYVEEVNLSIQWLPSKSNMNTVLEYNVWEGELSYTEAVDAGLRTRKVVLMETNHEAILKISELIREGDTKALQALVECDSFDSKKYWPVLGYDFVRNVPKIILTFD